MYKLFGDSINIFMMASFPSRNMLHFCVYLTLLCKILFVSYKSLNFVSKAGDFFVNIRILKKDILLLWADNMRIVWKEKLIVNGKLLCTMHDISRHFYTSYHFIIITSLLAVAYEAAVIAILQKKTLRLRIVNNLSFQFLFKFEGRDLIFVSCQLN